MIKKILEKIGIVLFTIVIIAIALFSLFLGFSSVADIIVKVVSFVGCGSIGWGIILAPFFIFGVVQIIRGFFAIIENDLNQVNSKKYSIWHYLYIPASILGYIAVALVLFNN